MARRERPEYILLEASGVAEPSGIALTFADHSLREQVRLDSITCVLDAEQVFAAAELMELKIRQIAFSDMVVLNKADLTGEAQIKKIKAWLDSGMHRYWLIEAVRCDVPLEILLSVGRFDPSHMKLSRAAAGGKHNRHHHHSLSPKFSAWSFQTDYPLSLEALRQAASTLPVNIYRAKGLV